MKVNAPPVHTYPRNDVIRIFVSYSHDSGEHKARVREFADRLKAEGDLEIILDQFEPDGGPDRGWPNWSERHATSADRVLVVMSEAYGQCWAGNCPPGMREGATHEALILQKRVSMEGATLTFLRSVVFDESDKQWMPLRLRSVNIFHAVANFPELLGWLRQTAVIAQGKGPLRWPAKVAFQAPLADRKKEFDVLRDMLSGGHACRILLIRGESGSGKTAFVKAGLDYAKELGVKHSHVDFKGCPTFEDIVGVLRAELPAVFGRGQQNRGKHDLYRFLEHLRDQQEPLLLALDSYEQASDQVRSWAEANLMKVDGMPDLVIVVSGQRVPDPTAYPWGSHAHETPFGPIDNVEDWLEFLKHRPSGSSIDRTFMEMVTRGHRGRPNLISSLLIELTR